MPYLAIIIDSGLPIQIHLIVERIILDSTTSVVKGMCGLIAACMLCIQYNLSIIILPNANLYSTFIPHGCCRQATGSTSTYKNLQLLDYFKNRSSMYRTDKNLLLNFLCWFLKCQAKPTFLDPCIYSSTLLQSLTVPYALCQKLKKYNIRKQHLYHQTSRIVDWAVPIVPEVKADKSIRLCGDFKLTVNKASKFDWYSTKNCTYIMYHYIQSFTFNSESCLYVPGIITNHTEGSLKLFSVITDMVFRKRILGHSV